MSKTTNGAKIDESRYVYQATRFIYEGNSDSTVCKLLKDRYGFEVSVPCVSAYKKHHYDRRLKEMIEFSGSFQKQQSGRIKTFIDESMEQATAIKQQIADIEKQQVILDREIAFCTKFDGVFKHAIDSYLETFDPEHPTEFLNNPISTEETLLAAAIASMGEENRFALTKYIESRGPQQLYKLRAYLNEKLLDYRESIVKIHKDVFKSYRNYSILQELTLIFEEYNAIIIEEFFPDRNSIDKEKYTKVKQRILALYDKLQIRYQGVEAPSDHSHTQPTPAAAQALAEQATKQLPKEKPREPSMNKQGRPASKIRTVIRERERTTTIEEESLPQEVEASVVDVSTAISNISEEQALRATDKLVQEGANEMPSVSQLSTDLDNTVKREPSPLVDPMEAMPSDDLPDMEPTVEELYGEDSETVEETVEAPEEHQPEAQDKE